MPDEPDVRPEQHDDVLDLGSRRSWPRWARIGVWAALVALAAGAAVVLGGRSSHHEAGPTPGPTSGGPRISAPIGSAQDDLAVDGNLLYRLSHGVIYRLDITDPQAPTDDGVAPVDGLDRTLTDATYHLVLDTSHHRIWVVTYGAVPATVVEFDSRTLTELGRALWPSTVSSAAALDGHVYLAAVNAVVDFASAKAAPATLGGLNGQYLSIVADPARSRLLLLDADRGRVVAYRPSAGRSSVGAAVGFSKGDLLVVDGRIWAAGFGNRGAVLTRLDPKTLKRVAFSALSPQLGPGAIAVASGERVFWIRSGAGGDGLWCVSARTGDQLQYWQYVGAVASRRGAAYLATNNGPQPLQLGKCTG